MRKPFPKHRLPHLLIAGGVVCLAACLLVAFAFGTAAVPVLLFLSVGLNTAGIFMLGGKKK